MTQEEWFEFQRTKGTSLAFEKCMVPRDFIGGMWLYHNRPHVKATIVKLTKSNMVGVIKDGEKNIQALPYNLVKLIGDGE